MARSQFSSKKPLKESIFFEETIIKNTRKDLELLSNIIDNLPISIYWKNIEGIYLGSNERMLKLVKEKKIEGKKDPDLLFMKDFQNLRDVEEKVIKSGKIQKTEQTFILHSRKKIILSIEVGPLFNKNKEITGVLGVLVDITNHKKLEEPLKESKDQAEFILKNIVANMPAHVYWKDKNGVYLGCNNRQAQSLGLKKGTQVIGKTDFDLPWPKESAKAFRENDIRIMQSGKTEVFEEKIIINGKEGIALSHKTPLRNKTGEIVGILGISIDITDRKAAEEALKKAKELAEAANQAKSKFIANMSHDIRTPMNGVIGIADILKREGTTKKDKEYGQIIYSSAQILLHLLNDILDLIQINDLTEENIKYDVIDLRQILNNLKELILPSLKTKNIHFELNISSDVPNSIISDRVKLDRILLNIVSNSIKFTDKGTISVNVKVVNKVGTKYTLEFIISDTGIGIQKSEIHKIFDLFYRAIPSHEGTYEGHGIGLYIAKKFVQTLKGKIKVKSEVGHGTSFFFQLPVLIGSSENNLSYDPLATKIIPGTKIKKDSSELTHNISKNKSGRYKVLLIEDDILAQKVGQYYLESENLEVHTTPTAEMAIKMVKTLPFDLIISDIGLPGLNGSEFAVLIRYWEKITNKKPMPIIGLSAHSSKSVKEEAINAGINAVLTKPLNDQKIKEIISLLENTKKGSVSNKIQDKSVLGTELPDTEKELFQLDKVPLFDEKNAIDKMGNKKTLIGVLLVLIKETIPEELSKLKAAHHQKDWNQIQKLAHKLKGGALYCGTTRMFYASHYLEKYRLGENDKILEKLYTQLIRVLNQTHDTIEEYVRLQS